MKNILSILVISTFLFSCTNESSIEATGEILTEYRVVKDEAKHNIKRSIEVVLEKKASVSELETLARKLRNSNPTSFQRTFIGYFILDDNKESGYWASSHFNPNLEVKILGLTIEQEKSLAEQQLSKDLGVFLGSWLEDRPMIGRKISIFDAGDFLILEDSYPDGVSVSKKMKSRNEQGGLRVEDADGNDFGEFFLINSKGNLEFWSKNGNYYTAKKFP
jgi:hypothetical protein